MTSETEQQTMDIKELLKKMNQTWAYGDPQELKNYFHEDMMIIAPDLKILGKGRNACIQSYIDFLNRADMKSFKEDDPDIFVYGNTAIAFCKYDIGWTMEGKSYKEKGKELYVLSQDNKTWSVVMRKLIPNT